MKVRNILYIILMVIFTVFAYFLFDRGFNVKTKIVVNYQEKSDLNYRVYLHDNDIYNREYLGMNDKYISKLVDNIMTKEKLKKSILKKNENKNENLDCHHIGC